MCNLGDAPSADRNIDDEDRSEEVPAEQPEGGRGHAAEAAGATTAGRPQQPLGRLPTGSGSHAAAAGQQEAPGPAAGGNVRVVQRRSVDNPLLAGSGSSQRLGSGGPVSWAEVQAKMCIDERLNAAGSGRPAGTGARTKVTILKPLV